MKKRLDSLAFGIFLVMEGAIGCCDLLNCRMSSRRDLSRIGKLAMAKGWLDERQVSEILDCQKRCGGLFGELAVRFRYLTAEQISLLLREQKEDRNSLCEEIVVRGILSQKQIETSLMKYERSRSSRRLIQTSS